MVLSVAPRTSRKSADHFARRAQMALAVHGQQSSGAVELGVIADGGKQVENLAVVGFGVAHAVGGQQPADCRRARNADRGLIPPLFFALAMPLQFNVDIVCGRRCA